MGRHARRGRAAYLEGIDAADDLGFIEGLLGGLLPMATQMLGPGLQQAIGLATGGKGLGSIAPGLAGAGGAGAPGGNLLAGLLGQGGGAGALGPLTGLLGAMGGGGGGVDPTTALLASQAGKAPGTDVQTKGALDEIVQKGRQESAAKATRDEVQAAVSPELQAIKGQVEQLQRSERERLLLAEETRRRAWQALVLRRLDEILDRVEGGGASNARRY